MIKKHIFSLTGQCTACNAAQVLYFFEYKPPLKCQSVTPIKVTGATSRNEPLFQLVRVRLRFASTQNIRFSSSWLFAILKNTVQVRLRFDQISVKPVYKTPVRVRFDSLVFAFGNTSIINTLDSFEKSCFIPEAFREALVINIVCRASFLKSQKLSSVIFFSFNQGNRHRG